MRLELAFLGKLVYPAFVTLWLKKLRQKNSARIKEKAHLSNFYTQVTQIQPIDLKKHLEILWVFPLEVAKDGGLGTSNTTALG